MTPSRKSGFTLIEILVACSLLSFLLGGVFLLVQAGLRFLRQGEVQQTVHQQAQVASRRLTDELSNSDSGNIYFAADEVMFLSPEQLRNSPNYRLYTFSTGLLEWHKWVCYYRTANRELHRAEIGIAPITVPPNPAFTLTRPDFEAVVAPLNSVVARNISRLEITSGAVPQTFQVTISARGEVNSDQFTELNLTSTVKLNN